MQWFLGFVAVFAIGGITGVMLAIPPADFQLHNSLFLVAHFHSTVIGGVLFGLFCAINYWLPKMTGLKLNERIGRYAFWCWIVGFCMSFIPMFILGFMGAPRRMDRYDASTGWQPLFVLMLIGGIIIAIGVVLQLAQILATFIQRRRLHGANNDPWDGRTLEWSTASPAPFYNFAVIPKVTTRDAYLEMKRVGTTKTVYEDIHMPVNTAAGIYISGFAFLLGFAFVWEIVWLAVASAIGIIVVFVMRTFNDRTEYTLLAQEVRELEVASDKRSQASAAAGGSVTDEDMGLIKLVKVVIAFLWDIVRFQRWRKW
jgi:cytochrome o ubiquinol oxidase subunit 1